MIGDLIDVLMMTKRSIGGFIPNVSVSEQHTDTLEITDHPVQQGAAITDHAFKKPAELTMVVGWSNSSNLLASLVQGTLFSSPITDVSDIYKEFLDLQESRKLIDVVTGKRTYSNMLIKQLSTTTNKDSEYSLILTVLMRQVIIANVATTTSSVGDAVNQKAPEDTAAVAKQGTAQPKQVTNSSVLSNLGKLFGG